MCLLISFIGRFSDSSVTNGVGAVATATPVPTSSVSYLVADRPEIGQFVLFS